MYIPTSAMLMLKFFSSIDLYRIAIYKCKTVHITVDSVYVIMYHFDYIASVKTHFIGQGYFHILQ